MTGVPMVHGAERVMEIIESHGGLVVCMDNCTGLKPILDDVDETAADPIVALAEKYFRLPCSVMTKNSRRFDVLRNLAREYRAQCVIDLIWQACLTYDVESYFVKQAGGEGARHAVPADRDGLLALRFRQDRPAGRGAVRNRSAKGVRASMREFLHRTKMNVTDGVPGGSAPRPPVFFALSQQHEIGVVPERATVPCKVHGFF